MVKIFACVKCGQVYYINPPKKCMKTGFITKDCDSVEFERIEKKDVVNMHDVTNNLIKRILGIE